jgi:transposase
MNDLLDRAKTHAWWYSDRMLAEMLIDRIYQQAALIRFAEDFMPAKIVPHWRRFCEAGVRVTPTAPEENERRTTDAP